MNIKIETLSQLEDSINSLRCRRTTYLEFGKVMDELENYLIQELEDNYSNSGEQKDFNEAMNKIEELFQFVILSTENKLKTVSIK